MHPLFDQRRYLIPFRSSLLPQIFTDTLVIGAGVAGFRAALAATEPAGSRNTRTHPVSKSHPPECILICKDEPMLSSTAWAQGGIAAALANDDSVDSHVADTLNA